MSSVGYAPDEVSPPGATLRDALDERGLSTTEFADAAGLTREYVEWLVEGDVPVTPEVAATLEEAGFGDASFWLARERLSDDWLRAMYP